MRMRRSSSRMVMAVKGTQRANHSVTYVPPHYRRLSLFEVSHSYCGWNSCRYKGSCGQSTTKTLVNWLTWTH